jgi:hypothetical protein
MLPRSGDKIKSNRDINILAELFCCVAQRLVAKDGQRQQQPKQQAHDDQHDDIRFHGDAREARPRSLRLTTIAKPMNRFAVCGDPRAERGPRIER